MNLWTPMAVLNNSEHVFIGDIVEFRNGSEKCFGRIEQFILKVCTMLNIIMYQL